MNRVSLRSCLAGSMALLASLGVNCAPDDEHAGGVEPSASEADASDCGVANCDIPASGEYFLTSFGFTPGADDGVMSCGELTKSGTWYYAASRQRYGCGAHIKIEAKGKCVVAETDDYGPAAWVESDAGGPIIDASPLVSEHLFGVKGAGWSDHFRIKVTKVEKSTPLGPCTGSTGGDGDTSDLLPCYTSTLKKTVPTDTCVQSKDDKKWYLCDNGKWIGRWQKSDEAWCTSYYALPGGG